ncbi:MAG: radical SAM protein [Synergistaceae bacterium]|nr:radical SAM protein [Synergistaceae bacterium]
MGQDAERIQKVRRLKREVYGEYGFYYYVPMAESFAVQLPVTISCSYRRCLYCDLNQGMAFRELSPDEIAANLERLRFIHEEDTRPPTRFLLAGGNPFVLSSEKLSAIAAQVRAVFPSCETISCFARADDVLRKSGSELIALHQAGYDRLCLGIESGSDRVLRYQEKGVGRAENAGAMAALDAAGIRYSAYIMLGLGGQDLSGEHVAETASLLNQAHPFELTVVTLVLFKGARLAERVRSREFRRMTSLDTLKEGRELLSRLELSTVWNATHKTNLFPIKGKIPEHKELLLRRIDAAIQEMADGDLKQYELRRWQNWGTE